SDQPPYRRSGLPRQFGLNWRLQRFLTKNAAMFMNPCSGTVRIGRLARGSELCVSVHRNYEGGVIFQEAGSFANSFRVFCGKLASPQIRAMFFAGSWLPRKFVPCFLQEAGFPASSFRVFCRKLASPQVRSVFFAGSRLPCKFVSCFLQEASFPASSFHVFSKKPASLQVPVV